MSARPLEPIEAVLIAELLDFLVEEVELVSSDISPNALKMAMRSWSERLLETPATEAAR